MAKMQKCFGTSMLDPVAYLFPACWSSVVSILWFCTALLQYPSLFRGFSCAASSRSLFSCAE
eukprot:4262726-Amphidinium_carterae.1